MKKKATTRKIVNNKTNNKQKVAQAKSSFKKMMIEISPYLTKTKSKEISTVGQWRNTVSSVSY